MRWFKSRKSKSARRSPLMEKVEHIERSVEVIERVLSEQAAQKPAAQHPPVVHRSEADVTPFEPFEPFGQEASHE